MFEAQRYNFLLFSNVEQAPTRSNNNYINSMPTTNGQIYPKQKARYTRFTGFRVTNQSIDAPIGKEIDLDLGCWHDLFYSEVPLSHTKLDLAMVYES